MRSNIRFFSFFGSKKLLLTLGLFIFLAFVISGCGGRSQGVRQAITGEGSLREPFRTVHVEPSALRQVRRVVLAPIQVGPQAGMAKKHVARFEQRFAELALGRLGVETVNSQAVDKFLGTQEVTAEDKQAIHQKLRKHFKADSVLELTVTEFSDRKGSAVGALQPARVAARYDLFGKERNPVWASQYLFRDQALSDDFFSVGKRFSRKSGAGWRDAGELLEHSMEEALQALEKAREESFVRN